MLTFDNCGARLKNKKLVADDGVVLEVNGEKRPSSLVLHGADRTVGLLTLTIFRSRLPRM